MHINKCISLQSFLVIFTSFVKDSCAKLGYLYRESSCGMILNFRKTRDNVACELLSRVSFNALVELLPPSSLFIYTHRKRIMNCFTNLLKKESRVIFFFSLVTCLKAYPIIPRIDP